MSCAGTADETSHSSQSRDDLLARASVLLNAQLTHRSLSAGESPTLQPSANESKAGQRFRLPVELFSSDDDSADVEELDAMVAQHSNASSALNEASGTNCASGSATRTSRLQHSTASSMGPTMAAAIAAAEERWGAEKRRLEAELEWMRKQKAEDARVLQHTATLVGMLQESHRALVASNQRLLAQIAEDKARHELEVTEQARQFEELKAMVDEMAMATHQTTPRVPNAEKSGCKGGPRTGTTRSTIAFTTAGSR